MVTANYKLDKQELKDGGLDGDMVFSALPVAATRPELADAAE
jgi:hypothetical protein